MKKTAFTLLTVVLSTASALAQGAIEWSTSFTGIFRAPIYNYDPANPTLQVSGQSSLGVPVGTTVYGGALLSGAGYTLGLFVGAIGSTPDTFAMAASAPFNAVANPDALPNGLISAKTVVISGAPAGTRIAFQMRAWDNKGGSVSDWQAVLSRVDVARGVSEVVGSDPLGGFTPDGPILNPLTTGWTSFGLAIVPEPSTVSLAVLCLGALILFRRRR
jgi:hypothetical protein